MFILKSSLFSFIPGPKTVEWLDDSQYMTEIAEYNIPDIVRHLESYDGVTIEKNENDPRMLELIWNNGNRWIKMAFTTIDGAIDSCWGGSPIRTNCYISDIVKLWKHIKQAFPSSWIHDEECNLFSMKAFIKEFAEPFLQAVRDPEKNTSGEIKELNSLLGM